MVEEATTNMQERYYAHVNDLIVKLTYASLNQNVLLMKSIFKELHMVTQPFLTNKEWYKKKISQTNQILNPILPHITISEGGYSPKKGFTPTMAQHINTIGQIIDQMREQLYQDLHKAGLLTYKQQTKQQILE